jgi:hypothetical protein
MENELSRWFGDEATRERLGKLRWSDPDESLRERMKLLSRYPSEVVHLGFVKQILDHGWAVVWVSDDDVAYTIGLEYRFAHPELLLSAPDLDVETQKAILNDLGSRVAKGEKIASEEEVVVGAEVLTFHRYQDDTFEQLPCGYLARFEQFFADRFHESAGTLPILWTTSTSDDGSG